MTAERDVQAEASALDEQARHHKREERRHRQAARSARARLAELRASCARLGITLTINPAKEDIHGQAPVARPLDAR